MWMVLFGFVSCTKGFVCLPQLTGTYMFVQLNVHSDGLLFSCCRRRRKYPEREPLLPSRIDLTESLPDVLAAFKANKLPSQSQLNFFLQSVLHSDVLDVNGHGVTQGMDR